MEAKIDEKVGGLYVLPNDLNILHVCSGDNKDAILKGVCTLITSAIDRNIPSGSSHSERVAVLSASIAEELRLSPEEVNRIYLAGLLHDFGKLFLPSNILVKTEPLTDDDWSFIELHPQLAATFLERVPPLANIAKDVLHHHERIDGRGYPRQLSGEDIPLGSRIIAVAGAFDSMTSCNSYRKNIRQEAACDILKKDSGTQFDGGIVQALLAVLRRKKNTK